jgi:hypothetical protein
MKKSFVLLSCFFLLFGCQKQYKIDKTREDGVEVVLNHLQPYMIKGEPSTPVLEKDFSIDTEREDLLKTGLTDIETFDVDDQGNIFVIQWQSKENFVFKFDPQGHFMKSFLRFGQGPGELEYGGKVLINPQGELMAKDPSKPKFLVYDGDGHFLREMRLDRNFSPIPLANGGYFIFWGEDTPEYRKQFVGVCNSGFQNIKILAQFQYPNALNVRCPVNRDLLIYRTGSDKIYIGNTAKGYEIDVYSLEGNLLRKIRKEYNPVMVTEDIKKGYFETWPKDDPLRNNFYFTEHWPAYRGLFGDDEGRLFVLTYEAGGSPGEFLYDIFNSEGVFIGRISLANLKKLAAPRSFAIKFKKNRLYRLGEKENGYKELVAYKLSWK